MLAHVRHKFYSAALSVSRARTTIEIVIGERSYYRLAYSMVTINSGSGTIIARAHGDTFSHCVEVVVAATAAAHEIASPRDAVSYVRL